MNRHTAQRIVMFAAIGLIAPGAGADGFTELYSVAAAGRVHEAAGAFVPVFDNQGRRTGETVFLLHGGYPEELDARPISDVWVLDEAFWQHLSTDAPAMAGHSLVVGADGRAWAVGAIGHDGWIAPMNTLVAFEVRRIDGRLDVAVERVQVPGVAPRACFGSRAVAADCGRRIFSVGGACPGNPLNPDPGELWEYRIDANRWSRLSDLPGPVSDHSAVVARDYIWVHGGTGSAGPTSELYRYDLLTGVWSLLATAGESPAPRRAHRAVAAGNAMLVFGGIGEAFFPETLDDVWQLDLDTLIWRAKASLPDGLAAMALDVDRTGIGDDRRIEVLLYGGVLDAWSFPYDLSDSTMIYTSDIPTRRSPMVSGVGAAVVE